MLKVHTELIRIPSHIRRNRHNQTRKSLNNYLTLSVGILPVSKGISGRTSEHSGTTRSTRSSRSAAAPNDMDHVQIDIRRKVVATRVATRLEESPNPPHDGLKGRQLEIGIDVSLEIRIDRSHQQDQSKND